MYDDREYAMSRLTGTLVRLHGKPVMVKGMDEDLNCDLIDYLAASSIEGVPLRELDLKSPPLGFVNFGRRKCMYLARRPMRRDWRQGVRKGNVVAVGTDYYPDNTTIARCIAGVYPTLLEAVSKVVETGDTTAISRDFALSKSLSGVRINYKWYGVIGVLGKDNKPKVTKNFKFLSKLLKEALNVNS